MASEFTGSAKWFLTLKIILCLSLVAAQQAEETTEASKKDKNLLSEHLLPIGGQANISRSLPDLEGSGDSEAIHIESVGKSVGDNDFSDSANGDLEKLARAGTYNPEKDIDGSGEVDYITVDEPQTPLIIGDSEIFTTTVENLSVEKSKFDSADDKDETLAENKTDTEISDKNVSSLHETTHVEATTGSNDSTETTAEPNQEVSTTLKPLPEEAIVTTKETTLRENVTSVHQGSTVISETTTAATTTASVEHEKTTEVFAEGEKTESSIEELNTTVVPVEAQEAQNSTELPAEEETTTITTASTEAKIVLPTKEGQTILPREEEKTVAPTEEDKTTAQTEEGKTIILTGEKTTESGAEERSTTKGAPEAIAPASVETTASPVKEAEETTTRSEEKTTAEATPAIAISHSHETEKHTELPGQTRNDEVTTTGPAVVASEDDVDNHEHRVVDESTFIPVVVVEKEAAPETTTTKNFDHPEVKMEEPVIEQIFTETKVAHNSLAAVPGNILHKKNMTLGIDPLHIVTDTGVGDPEETVQMGSGDPRKTGAYIVIGLIILSFSSLVGYIVFRKRGNRKRQMYKGSPENQDTEKALLSLSDYKDSSELEENHLKNNEITPIVVKSNSQMNKFEKNTNFSSSKNLNTIANEKNIEKDNVLKSTADNLTQVIIEDSPKDQDDGRTSPVMEKLIVKTHIDQDSIPKKPIIINRTSTGYQPIPQDNQ